MADRSVRPLRHLVHAVTGGQPPSEAQVRQAAWIARCVGRGGSAPLHRDDVSALAETLQVKEFAPGAVDSTPIKPRTGCGLCDTD
ncbi:transcriptional regulator [Mycobacterium tuberculosis]|nr:transcriptional regulator [Mycobacterium tuberculosis]